MPPPSFQVKFAFSPPPPPPSHTLIHAAGSVQLFRSCKTILLTLPHLQARGWFELPCQRPEHPSQDTSGSWKTPPTPQPVWRSTATARRSRWTGRGSTSSGGWHKVVLTGMYGALVFERMAISNVSTLDDFGSHPYCTPPPQGFLFMFQFSFFY